MNVAIITARGGSKRIPRKNIKPFLGHPIIKYSIDAAINSKCFDEVMVSTDDKEIAEVALSYGAKVPFFRSAKTSNDHAVTADVIVEVLADYKKRDQKFEYACCIYPTAPFVTTEKLKRGFELLKKLDADAVIPVVRFSYPIQRALKIDNKGFLRMINQKNIFKMSRDFIPTYHDSGQFYWLKVANFLKQRALFAKHTVPIEIPELEAQDIDVKEDWKIAEFKYQIINQKI